VGPLQVEIERSVVTVRVSAANPMISLEPWAPPAARRTTGKSSGKKTKTPGTAATAVRKTPRRTRAGGPRRSPR
jgi:hypothetical protein